MNARFYVAALGIGALAQTAFAQIPKPADLLRHPLYGTYLEETPRILQEKGNFLSYIGIGDFDYDGKGPMIGGTKYRAFCHSAPYDETIHVWRIEGSNMVDYLYKSRWEGRSYFVETIEESFNGQVPRRTLVFYTDFESNKTEFEAAMELFRKTRQRARTLLKEKLGEGYGADNCLEKIMAAN